MAHSILLIILVPIGVALLVMLGILIATGIREGYFWKARSKD
jgi:hypothetical protein